MSKSGKFCAACKNKNPFDAVFCAYCGAPFLDDQSPRTTRRVTENVAFSERDAEILEAITPPPGIVFYVYGESAPMEPRMDEELVLGRKTDNAPGQESLVDLSPYGAFAMGVSRRHARIRKIAIGYEITDLDSSNGTWLNEHRIVPNKPYILDSGAKIRVGKLILVVTYK